MGIINSIFKEGGKGKMIFGAVCIVVGIIVYPLFDYIRYEQVTFFGIEILHRMTTALGQTGFSAFYIICGTIIFIWGWMDKRKMKKQ